MDREFNLLDEPWIRVMLPNFTQKELSLTDVLLKAHEIRDLAGELPAQDTAVLRLLLAVLHTVFSRCDENGDAYEIEEPDEALRRWGALWNEGSFPEIPVRRYLEEQHDRFWLFDQSARFFRFRESQARTIRLPSSTARCRRAIIRRGSFRRAPERVRPRSLTPRRRAGCFSSTVTTTPRLNPSRRGCRRRGPDGSAK